MLPQTNIEEMDLDGLASVVGRLVRRGIVTNVDQKKRRARVRFDDENMDSGWLRILSSPPFIPKVDGPQRTETASNHNHPVIITPWLPRVNDVVLTLFLPCHDSDGYILGRIEEDTNFV